MDGWVSCPWGTVTGFIFYGIGTQSVVELLTIGLLLTLSAIIATAEVAFFSLTPVHFEQLRTGTDKKAARVIQLLDKPKRLIATIVMSHNLINIGVVVISEILFDELFNFSSNPFMGFLIEVVIVTFIILLVGEVIPKIYASQKPEKLAIRLVSAFEIIQKLLAPFVYVLVLIANAFDKRITSKAPDLSVDQLSQALELTSKENTPDEERKILQGIVEFGNTEVSQIMKARIDVVAFEESTSFKEIIELILKHGFSRVPIYRDSLDNIVGVLYIKDLIAHLNKESDFKWQSIIRPAFFVPESKKIDDLMKEFQSKKIHLAIAVDEYGGTSGIVTLEDVIEEIIGEINDEFDEDELVYSKLDNQNYIFEAKILLNDLYRILEIDGSEFEEHKGESDTLAGFILERSGKIPSKNEKISFGNYMFTIESVDKRRIKRIKLTISHQSPNTPPKESGKIIPLLLILLSLPFLFTLQSCQNEFTPKPRGYFRIDMPMHTYQSFKEACPYTFEYSQQAQVKPYMGKLKETCWYNIYYPQYHATIHLSFNPIQNHNDLVDQLNNSRTLAYKHTVKADGIEEFPIFYQDKKVYGLKYSLSGNSASQTQFYVTDSTRYFVRCALYFSASPNADSIAPVLNFINQDMDRMIETFSWNH